MIFLLPLEHIYIYICAYNCYYYAHVFDTADKIRLLIELVHLYIQKVESK